MPMIQRLSLSLALTLNWGVRVASQESELFDEITHVEEEISRFRSTTGNLQDYIPLLRLDPFSRNSKKAAEMRIRRDKYLGSLNRDLDDRMEKGTHTPCIQANVIMDKEAKLNSEELTSISLTMLSGGLDTVTTLVAWSIGLLSTRPDVQDKAAKAIQEMYGQDEPMCSADDDQKCAYVAALVRECLRYVLPPLSEDEKDSTSTLTNFVNSCRYFTVLRLALPRTSIREITYQGIVIPKGTVFFLNAWACNMGNFDDTILRHLHANVESADPDVWTDPEEFRPERWLEQPDAPLFTYGMGYRMCAGSLLANRELYLVFMRTLNSFRIEPHDDTDWHPVRGNSDPTSLVAIPQRYKVRFVPKNVTALGKAVAQ